MFVEDEGLESPTLPRRARKEGAPLFVNDAGAHISKSRCGAPAFVGDDMTLKMTLMENVE
jgi:hypothetical protein